MCGRFTLRASTKELRNAFPFVDLPDLTARYNIAPTQQVAAIRMDADAGKPEFAWFRWGFLPPWAMTPRTSYQREVGNVQGAEHASPHSITMLLTKTRLETAQKAFGKVWDDQGVMSKLPFVVAARTRFWLL